MSYAHDMLMNHLLPFIARALGRPEATVRETVRQLRVKGLIAGAGGTGRLAPEATIEDVAKVILALISGERPLAAPDDLKRSLGLVKSYKGEETTLLHVLAVQLDCLVQHGRVEDIVGLRIAVSWPWPIAKMWSKDASGEAFEVTYHHFEAKRSVDPEADERKLEALMQKWGDGRACFWGETDLRALQIVADALAGRLARHELERRTTPTVEAVLWRENAAAVP